MKKLFAMFIILNIMKIHDAIILTYKNGNLYDQKPGTLQIF
jgi:hypothetical protein